MKLPEIIVRLYNYIFPMCPNGGHRQRGELITNVKGNSYCWHPDCIKENFKDVYDLNCIERCLPRCRCAKDMSPVPCCKVYK